MIIIYNYVITNHKIYIFQKMLVQILEKNAGSFLAIR